MSVSPLLGDECSSWGRVEVAPSLGTPGAHCCSAAVAWAGSANSWPPGSALLITLSSGPVIRFDSRSARAGAQAPALLPTVLPSSWWPLSRGLYTPVCSVLEDKPGLRP